MEGEGNGREWKGDGIGYASYLFLPCKSSSKVGVGDKSMGEGRRRKKKEERKKKKERKKERRKKEKRKKERRKKEKRKKERKNSDCVQTSFHIRYYLQRTISRRFTIAKGQKYVSYFKNPFPFPYTH